ncbi:Mobile element protein [Candidatus Enterovibrio altilux]|uniref:Mobile element protein n=1 Tax=Candidatus Enterovibrio altilux TaxID=1927128 RepID=A0A291B9V8_9GAMM|nr:Mobile element protein [Candidatus Enterovibrio luxaltus]
MMVLMVKCIFSMPLKALQGFINSICNLARLSFSCPHYSCISKRAKIVNITFKTKTKKIILYLTIDSTELKIDSNSE